ncbi:MAG: hypothetical protein H0S79_25525, partial [Anaerolineaceae bacterium]|nr:hypothetical protein [Anaerolineaceae bacterium]
MLQVMKAERKALLRIILSIMIVFILAGCGKPAMDYSDVDYAPTSKYWPVSTPADEGIDPDLVAELYYNASQLPTVYSLLVFKNDKLIAEDCFNIGAPNLQVNIHSVTKSITSALVGIA